MGRLRDALLREAQDDERKAARELVSNAEDGCQPRQRGMAALGDEVRRQQRETALRAGRTFAAENADLPRDRLKAALYANFGIGGSDLDSIVDSVQ